jgi:hypothetical protein
MPALVARAVAAARERAEQLSGSGAKRRKT